MQQQFRTVGRLQAHAINHRIYGDEALPDEFVASIKARGILEPIQIKSDGTIISGHRRWQAAKQIGLDAVPVTICDYASDLDERLALIEFNRQREKTFTQKMNEAEELEAIEKERAKLRQAKNARRNQPQSQKVANLPPLENAGKTREKVAKQTGIGSARTYDTAKKLWTKAKEGDEVAAKLVEAVDSGKESISGAYKKLEGEKKKAERQELIQKQREDIATGKVELPPGVFEVVAIDPPWSYGREYDPDGSRVANPYPEMTQEELLALEPPFAKDCVLFLWTTHQFIWDAKALLDHWGFTYKATGVWDKEKIGMGSWLRMQCEFFLVGIKGKPTWNNTKWRDIIRESRRQHSRKPDAFYEMVADITVGRRLEYFSREKRQGWEVVGNDVEKF